MSVTDTIPDGVDTPNGATLTPDRSTYEAVSETRGVVQLGPCRIRRTDPFGLVKLDTIDSTAVTEFITFPSVHPLTAIPGQSHGSPRHVAARDRDEFERLREYEQGDPLRDVDWKSSAKRDCRPLIVTEFASPAPAGRVLIAAESDPDRVEEMAEATASLADHFLADGLAVGVSTRDQEVAIGSGDAHRLRILSALALTEGGRASQRVREAGTIVVQALEDREVLVLADGERTPFDQLRGTTVRSPTPASRLSAGVPDGGSRP